MIRRSNKDSLQNCLAPIAGGKGNALIYVYPSDTLRYNRPNVYPINLLQILVTNGDKEGKMGSRKEIGNRSKEFL